MMISIENKMSVNRTIRTCFIMGMLLLISACENQSVEEDVDENESTTNVVEVEPIEIPDRTIYIDEQIAADKKIVFKNVVNDEQQEEKRVFVEEDASFFEVKLYEGTLMKASGSQEGFKLRFEPYNYWDDALEMEVESHYDFSVDINISKEQNKTLGFVDFTEATENIAWDFHENLFLVYYFEKENSNFPLKFINLGKTEWDG